MRKTKKQRVALMEGAHHDKPPHYSRKRRVPFDGDIGEAFNRRLEAQALAGDPEALMLIAAFNELI